MTLNTTPCFSVSNRFSENNSSTVERPGTLAAMMYQISQARPHDVAVVGPGADTDDISFADLAIGAASIATALNAAQNASVVDVVGLFVEPSENMSLALWGCLWSGHGYVPLAPEYPDDRLSYIIEHSGLKQLVVQSDLVDRLRDLAPLDIEILRLEDLLVGIKDETRTPEEIHPLPKNDTLAYVIYTSGSTGCPKGVEVQQSAVVHQMRWLAEQEYLTPDTRILQKTPISFDAAQWEILAPAVGACTVAGSVGLYRDIDALIERISDAGVTHLQAVPTLLSALIQRDDFREQKGLRAVFSGGEALSRKLAGSILANMPWLKLVNLYGPTETTINATAYEVTPHDLVHDEAIICIGRPVSGLRCDVLNAELGSAAVGEEGELYISGPQVARGYRNAPEQTADRFIERPEELGGRMYRTGDKCCWLSDGTLRFLGRLDHQVKLRGYRVELEEISSAIATNPWVNTASVVITQDERSGEDRLTACIELNARQAAVMDQGVADSHHRSKQNKHQVKAQLANVGLRPENPNEPMVALQGRLETAEMREEVFARKTYRFFDGEPLDLGQITEFLEGWQRQMAGGPVGTFAALTLDRLGGVLRWMGQFHSDERLLPKYAYASPGALYATQLYLETRGISGLQDGFQYYDPAQHCLRFVAQSAPHSTVLDGGIRLHFAGRHTPFESVYKTNVVEVMEIETGHMLGVLSKHLATFGQGVSPTEGCEDLIPRLGLPNEDHNLAAFDIVPVALRWRPDLDIFVQQQPYGITGLQNGMHHLVQGQLRRISTDIIKENDVIAINQAVYARSSVGIALVGRETDEALNYIALGFAMHHAQANTLGLGFMSSGYSSHSGHPLPAARRLDRILSDCEIEAGPMYFFMGGQVNPAQISSQGMHEDAVHMEGPAEMIRKQLKRSLPDYMIPNNVVIFDKIPITANGKVDHKAVKTAPQLREALAPRPYVAPQGETQIRLAALWSELLNVEEISQDDDFFLLGGNSLGAISLLHRIANLFGCKLPTQSIFEHSVLRELAKEIERNCANRQQAPQSRLVKLNQQETGQPIFIWPGLGGYPMKLRALAQELDRPVFGVQARGLNEGEIPASTIAEMAREDLAELTVQYPDGPITLWGYSFGARVAFEAAWQLEQQGRELDQLVLICPGNPSLPPELATVGDSKGTLPNTARPRRASLQDPSYLAILLSVFAGQIDIERTRRLLVECVEGNHQSFLDHLAREEPEIPRDMAARIVDIVQTTYQFEYTFTELLGRRLHAPVTVIKAKGDDYSFLENTSGFASQPVKTLTMPQDHYQVLQTPHVRDLAGLIQRSALGKSPSASLEIQD
ncbi:amino acid adenylation domain-containing protein [Epibacterium ulvae]|uniref:amino acid adenylation domain-containing protein n=1 Tax=Epibacterium ulvae TaxID=1156985 RepID=UPI002493A972|nr:amino acid adenylation domain-containing protein [Epibacterium ulvae]